jgi:hypothetical protein
LQDDTTGILNCHPTIFKFLIILFSCLGNFRETITQLMMTPETLDAFEINKALNTSYKVLKLQFDFRLLIEIFITRKSTQLEKIKKAYEKGIFYI